MVLIALLGVVVAATAIGLFALWLTGEGRPVPERSTRVRTDPARVTKLAEIPCRVGRRTCTRVTVELLEGADKGRKVSFTTGEAGPDVELDIGDRIRVYKNRLPPQAVIGGARVDPYSFLEAVAEQVVATLVGSIGLIAAVPVTTALAAALATQITRERLTREQHLEHVH